MKALILDVNVVLIVSPRLSDRFAAAYGVPLEKFLPALKDVLEKVRMPGADSLYSYFKPHLEEWDVAMTQAELENFWFGAETENKEVVGLIRELRARGVRLFVLSNNLRERTSYYHEQFPFLNELFEKTYYSWQTGFVKPDLRAYELLLTEGNLKPEECTYFDDSGENVEAARKLGIESFLFTSAEQMKKVLR